MKFLKEISKKLSKLKILLLLWSRLLPSLPLALRHRLRSELSIVIVLRPPAPLPLLIYRFKIPSCSGGRIIDEVPQPFPLIYAIDLPFLAPSSHSSSIDRIWIRSGYIGSALVSVLRTPQRMAVSGPMTPGQVRGISVILDPFWFFCFSWVEFWLVHLTFCGHAVRSRSSYIFFFFFGYEKIYDNSWCLLSIKMLAFWVTFLSDNVEVVWELRASLSF